MRFKNTSILCYGCQDVLTDSELCVMIVDSLIDQGVLPKKFFPGSSIKVEVNFEYSVPDFVKNEL